MTLSRRGMILILSSPSGAGKTTLTRMLMQDKALDLTLSVSVTTRPRRSSEVDGIHYRFVDRREFDHMKAEGDLLEWAEVHGNAYGTPRAPVDKVLAEGRDMLFDIDWQGAAAGARAARRRRRVDLRPAAVDDGIAREARTAGRGFGDHHRSAARGGRAEIERWRNYHYVIVNDDLQRAYQDVLAIVAAERLKVRRVQAGVEPFVESLSKG